MRQPLLIALSLASIFAFAQTPISGYKFNNTLDPYISNSPHVLPLEHRTGAIPTQPFGPTTYSTESVGAISKTVAQFQAPQFFRANHGMSANGAGGYVNLYTIVMDVKFSAPAAGSFSSLFNTTADCGNDGDSFVRWDDNGAGGSIGRIGISGVYAGDITPDAWHRIVVTVDCTANLGASTALTYYVDGAMVNQVEGSGGLDGRWAAYSWDDNDVDSDAVNLLGDEDGDNGSGQLSLAVFYEDVLSTPQVIELGAVGSPIGGSVSTETLAPTAEQVVFGTTNSGGNLASWAADDANGRKVCRFFIPNAQIMTRMRLSYTTTKAAPTAASFNVKISAHTPIVQQVTLRVENKVTNQFVNTNVVLANIVDGSTYSGVPVGNLAEYVGAGGAMRGEIEIKQTGITALSFPCTTFEFGQMAVTG